MKKSKHSWLDRRISAPGPYLALVLSDAEYRAAMADLGMKPDGPWIATPHAHATAHIMEAPGKGLAAVVALSSYEGRNPIEVAGLLVHEAVHVWQHYAGHYGEQSPGDEQEAYAIQSIAQELMAEFARRLAQ